eukprot:3619793-Pyramimonas_sp.AAC.1
MSSRAWLKKQHAIVARAAAAADGRAPREKRDYRILVAARGALEGRTLMQLRGLLFMPALWMLIHEPGVTNRTRALAFRQISKAGAGLEKSM